MEKLDRIKDEINDMSQTVSTEKIMGSDSDEEIEELNNKVKKLEEQIKNLVD